MAKKIRLDPVASDVNALIGMATQLKDYRLAHFINSRLDISLENVADLPVFNVKAEDFSHFSFFKYSHPDLRTDFYLISNFNGTQYLIPSLKQISFLLILQGAAYKQHIDEFVAGLRKITGVQAVIPINQASIKDLGPILDDLELHVLDLKKKEME